MYGIIKKKMKITHHPTISGWDISFWITLQAYVPIPVLETMHI